jgi:hypothetical protein
MNTIPPKYRVSLCIKEFSDKHTCMPKIFH